MRYTRRNIFQEITKRLLISKKLMLYKGLLTLAITAVSLVSPYLYKLLVDHVMTAGNMKLLYVIIPAMIGVYVAKVAISAFHTYISKKFVNLTNLEIKKQLMKRFLYRDINYSVGVDVGKQSGNIEQDSESVHLFLDNHVVNYITSFIVAMIYLILMLLINHWLGLISVVLLPVTILFSKAIGEKHNKVSKQRFEVTSITRTHLFDTVQKWREIKSNTLEEQFSLEYVNRLEPEKEQNCKKMLYYAFMDAFYIIKNEFVMKILIYFIGGLFIISKEITIGELLMFMSYMESMSVALDTLMRSNSEFINQKAVFERLFNILDEENVTGKQMCPNNPTISLQNVDFSYTSSQDKVLSNVSCEFAYGKKYLIVGRSGEGKSTLIKLLLGINKANNGEVLVNNTPIYLIDSRSLLKNVGAVMQENMFFNVSIRENFRLIAPSASEEDIKRVVKLACLDEFINMLPQKLDTVIGERGIKLSGGQKQRLAIARLILHNPQIVILDEATSALDAIVESEIMENLNREFVGKTMIVISHKLLANYQMDYVLRSEKQKLVYEVF